MKKRLTKEQREAAEKAALLQRVRDVLIGAGEWPGDEGEVIYVKGAGALLTWLAEHLEVTSIEKAAAHRQSHLFGWWNLDEMKSAAEVVDFWYRNGVRA